MKKSLYFSFVLTVFLLFISCDTPMSKYGPKNDDERNILKVLNTHVEARNNGDTKTLASLFQDDGVITYSSVKYTKSQIADSDPGLWSQYNIALYNLEIDISDGEATVSTFVVAKMGFDKWRTQTTFTLTKDDNKWLISEVTGYGSGK